MLEGSPLERLFTASPARLVFLPCLLSSLLIFPTAATAQNREAAFEGLVEVSEVLIDVIATDPEGEVVPGLGVDDFIVEEDGRLVEITGVSYYTTRYGDEGAEPGEIPSSRYLILFFHDQARDGDIDPYAMRQLYLAGRQSQEFIEGQLLGSDWVAVVSYDSKLRVHQDFTQDRDALLFAVEQAIGDRSPEKAEPRRRRPSGTAPSLLRRLPQTDTLYRETRSIHDALRHLAEATGYIVGRKNLLLLTAGFGEEGDEQTPDYIAMETAVNDHNVALYPIHLGGVGIGQPHGVFLDRLAENTGGRYYENVRQFLAPLARVSDENYGYYLLSYQSEHPAGEIGYERIEVKARDPRVELRARKGYRYGL